MASQTYNGVTFDDSVDYQSQLNSIKNSLYDAESYRNAKISGMTDEQKKKLGVDTSSLYSKYAYSSGKDYNSYDSTTDYQAQINSLLQQGAAAEVARNAKIAWMDANGTNPYAYQQSYDFVNKPVEAVSTTGAGNTASGDTLSNAVNNTVDSGVSSIKSEGTDYLNNIKTVDTDLLYDWNDATYNKLAAQLDSNYASDVANAKRTYNESVQDYESQKEDIKQNYINNMSDLYSDTYYNNAKLQEMAASRGIASSAIGLSLVNSGLVNAANMSAYYAALRDSDINKVETSLNKIANDLNVDLDQLEAKLKSDKISALSETEAQFIELLMEANQFNATTYDDAYGKYYDAIADAISSGIGYKSSALATESEQAFDNYQRQQSEQHESDMLDKELAANGSSGYYGSGGYSYGSYGSYGSGYSSGSGYTYSDSTLKSIDSAIHVYSATARDLKTSAYNDALEELEIIREKYLNGEMTAANANDAMNRVAKKVSIPTSVSNAVANQKTSTISSGSSSGSKSSGSSSSSNSNNNKTTSQITINLKNGTTTTTTNDKKTGTISGTVSTKSAYTNGSKSSWF